MLRQESSVATLGRLHVRIKYDYRTSDLIVHLIEGSAVTSSCASFCRDIIVCTFMVVIP